MGRFWMFLDAMTILASVVLATIYRKHTSPIMGAKGFWHGTLIHGRSMEILLALLCGFAISLMITSRRLNLYSPTKLSNILHEQRLSAQTALLICRECGIAPKLTKRSKYFEIAAALYGAIPKAYLDHQCCWALKRKTTAEKLRV